MSKRPFLPPDPPRPGDGINAVIAWAISLTDEVKGYFEVADQPPRTERRILPVGETDAGAAAVSAKFVAHAAMRMRTAHVHVTVAGTSTGHALTIKTGTSSLADPIMLGTSSVGTTTAIDMAYADVAANALVYVEGGADATGRAAITFQADEVTNAAA